jgi:glycosyltransferase involved in cell wall biosynthesis
MSANPLVSIMMNCYNGEEYLEETLHSVINQTYENWEIIFWDNRSIDRSKEIFESFQDKRLKYFLAPEHTNLGIARSIAFDKVNGEYLAILDDDDLWLPNKLEVQIPVFKNSDIGIVISDTLYFNTDREKRLYKSGYPPSGYVFENLLKNYFVSLETVVMRMSTVRSLLYAFDPSFNVTSDFDIVMRVSMVSKLYVCHEVLAKWRKHSMSLTHTTPRSFVQEREAWIEKQINLDEKLEKNYKNSIKYFKKKNNRISTAFYLIENKRLLALRSIFKSKLTNWQDFGLFVLCLMPFPGKIIIFLRNIKWLFSFSRS